MVFSPPLSNFFFDEEEFLDLRVGAMDAPPRPRPSALASPRRHIILSGFVNSLASRRLSLPWTRTAYKGHFYGRYLLLCQVGVAWRGVARRSVVCGGVGGTCLQHFYSRLRLLSVEVMESLNFGETFV